MDVKMNLDSNELIVVRKGSKQGTQCIYLEIGKDR